MSPEVSVIVPTYNRSQILRRSLATLFGQDLPRRLWELIVVVDGSSDGTLGTIGRLDAPCCMRIIEQSNRGQGSARNTGLLEARGDIVVFIDDDIFCSTSLLKEHLEAHGDHEEKVVFGPVYLDPRSPLSLAADYEKKWREKINSRLNRGIGPEFPYDFYIGNNTSAPRSLLLRAGGFDESMLRFEEHEFGLRVQKMAVPFRFWPRAVVHHFYDKTICAVLKQEAACGRSQVLTCRKHPEFRAYSHLALLGSGNLAKRKFREALVRLPLCGDIIAPACLVTLNKLRALPAVRRLGLRLLEIEMSVNRFRGALREVGSWHTLSDQYSLSCGRPQLPAPASSPGR